MMSGAISEPASSFSKRAVDLVAALVVLIAFAPVTIVAFALLRCTRTGPLLRSEIFVGLRGATFKKWSWALPGRRPFAWVERFLTEDLSLIPALISVLAGDMAFVGPASRTQQQHEALAKIAPGHGRLLSARPGVIGVLDGNRHSVGRLAQINAELRYVENWRLQTDLAQIAHRAIAFPLKRGGMNL